MKPSIPAATAALCLALCAAAAASRDVHAGALTISGAWSRPTPPGAPTAVGYLTVTNTGDRPDRLVGASSSASATLGLHSMSMAGGVMRMRPVPGGLAVAPKATVSLSPAGYHLMFEGLKRPFKPGDKIPAILRFQYAGPVRVTFDVGDGPGSGQAAPMPMNMPMH